MTAVIVSTARTPVGKAYRGAFNNTPTPTLAAHAVRAALARASLDGTEVEELVMGCGRPEGTQGKNVARHTAFRSGLPAATAAFTVSRHCASGLQAIVTAAHRIIVDGVSVVVAAGAESISLVQNEHTNEHYGKDPWLVEHRPEIFMPMLETAEIVARRYGISRERQDEYALMSQKRTAAAQENGLFADEIVPMTVSKKMLDKATGKASLVEVLLAQDEGNRPGTTRQSLAELKPILGEEAMITAGNASQLSDGAAACVLMSEAEASRRDLTPIGKFLGFATAGCEPEEMGIGPVFAVPKLLSRAGLSVSDIDLWELNEAFAVQVLYCQHVLGIPDEKLNVNGGAISIGHPYGMSGIRMTGHALLEGRRRNAKFAIITMCVGGGQGAAALFEILR